MDPRQDDVIEVNGEKRKVLRVEKLSALPAWANPRIVFTRVGPDRDMRSPDEAKLLQAEAEEKRALRAWRDLKKAFGATDPRTMAAANEATKLSAEAHVLRKKFHERK